MKKFLMGLLIIVIFMSGWVRGIVRFCECDFKESYKAEVIYGVGVVTGLNVILGHFYFGK